MDASPDSDIDSVTDTLASRLSTPAAQRTSPPDLLEATYIHAQGIGPTTERKLWEAGARSWDAYLAQPDTHWPLGRAQRAFLRPTIEESRERLEAEDFTYFAGKLPLSEHWRAAAAFGHRLAFVDIETNGGMDPRDLTVVGVFDGFRMRQYVQGYNLEQFPESLDDAAVLVTFFGTGFDIPFLRRAFPQLPMPQMHIDLCYLFKRLGYRGGLKSIEQQLGLARSRATTGLSGMDAVRLWEEYRFGHKEALKTLLTYNTEDVKNMATLLSIGYRKMAEGLMP